MTNVSVVKGIVASVSSPILMAFPETPISSEDMEQVYAAIEAMLEKISEKLGVKFFISVESADYFDGYETLVNISEEQRDEIESELWT